MATKRAPVGGRSRKRRSSPSKFHPDRKAGSRFSTRRAYMAAGLETVNVDHLNYPRISAVPLEASADYWPSMPTNESTSGTLLLPDIRCNTSELAAHPPLNPGLGGARGVSAATAVGANPAMRRNRR